MNILKKCGVVLTNFLILSACTPETSEQQISSAIAENKSSNLQVADVEVTNANNFALQQEPIYFSFYDLGIASDSEATKHLAISGSDRTYPTQIIDRDGDDQSDGILLAVDLSAAEKKTFVISSDASIEKPVLKKQTQAEISIKEGGEWKGKEYIGGSFKNVDKVTLPPQYTDHSFWIRYEGPGIESDQVAYRVYLDWRNGFDIFGKKTKDVVLQNVGLDGYDSYHESSDWGQDILKVGQSLGMGGFGFWNGKEVELVSKVDSRDAVITNNGNLYSSFDIHYNAWQINNQTLNLKANFSMTAASRLVRVKLDADQQLPNFAIGLVKHPNTELLQGSTEITGQAWTYVASWGKQSLSGADDYLGMAIFFKRGDRQLQTEDANSYVSVMNDNGGNLEYYFAAVWDQDLAGIKTKEQFQSYLNREVERLTKAPRVELHTSTSEQEKAQALTADVALKWSQRLADSELARKTLSYAYGGWDVNRQRPPKFEYDVAGLQILALQELNKLSNNNAYSNAAEQVTGSFVSEEGKIHTFNPELFSIDLTNPGRVLINLEQSTKKEKYRKAVDYLRDRLRVHPRTSEGAFWHRATYPNQLWLDGVYMGIPFLVQYAATYESGDRQHESFKEAVHEFEITRKQLRDEKTGLYYHAWDESKKMNWADKATGRSPEFWSRAMGWLAMAMVDTLDYLPESEPELRKTMIDMVNEFAGDLAKYQDTETATWWQITNKPREIGNYHESTSSAMFSYFYAKAVNKGYLSDSYKSFAEKTYQGLINEFVLVHADGKISMTGQCLVAGLGFGRDGSYDYYMTEPIVSNDAKGNGPFILAGVEMYKLLKK